MARSRKTKQETENTKSSASTEDATIAASDVGEPEASDAGTEASSSTAPEKVEEAATEASDETTKAETLVHTEDDEDAKAESADGSKEELEAADPQTSDESEGTDTLTQADGDEVVEAESAEGSGEEGGGETGPTSDTDSGPVEPDRGVAPQSDVSVAESGPPPRQTSSGASVALLVLGGLIAGFIGVIAARYADDLLGRSAEGPTPIENATTIAEQSALIEAQSQQIVALREQVEALAARDVVAEIEAGTAPFASELDNATSRLDAVSSDLSALTEQVETLALRPVATGMEPEEFDEALSEFRADLQAAIGSAQAEIETARATAEQISSDAFATEQAAVARAAWSQVETALDSGAPYGEPLEQVRQSLDVPIPDILSAHADAGVTPLPILQEDFPPVARDALEASVRALSGEGAMDRLSAFLRVQTGVRSLKPRDGDDPDAVLSRAEAALQGGNLDDALAELKGLPDAGQSALSDWVALAETRVDVLTAAADLAASFE